MGTSETGGVGIDIAKATLPGRVFTTTVVFTAPQYKRTLCISIREFVKDRLTSNQVKQRVR
jgi:hypothetical protein